jgi:hypothetical protein
VPVTEAIPLTAGGMNMKYIQDYPKLPRRHVQCKPGQTGVPTASIRGTPLQCFPLSRSVANTASTATGASAGDSSESSHAIGRTSVRSFGTTAFRNTTSSPS